MKIKKDRYGGYMYPRNVNTLWTLKVRGNSWEWKPYRLNKTVRLKYKFLEWYLKGEMFMKNRNLVIGLGLFALSMQTFTFICGDALLSDYVNAFSSASTITLALALIISILSNKSEIEIQSERDSFYRDIDAIYRYVDDNVRDVKDSIRDCERTTKCKNSCTNKSEV